MVSIAIESGPRCGMVFSSSQFEKPEDVFAPLLSEGAEWSLNFTMATYEEKKAWGSCDFDARCARALVQGKEVWINGRKFGPLNGKKIESIAPEIEKEMASFGGKGWLTCFEQKTRLIVRFKKFDAGKSCN